MTTFPQFAIEDAPLGAVPGVRLHGELDVHTAPELTATLDDIVRTRIYLRDASQWEPVARVHGRYFGDIRPANTLVGIADLVGGYEVEIEAEAIVEGRL